MKNLQTLENWVKLEKSQSPTSIVNPSFEKTFAFLPTKLCFGKKIFFRHYIKVTIWNLFGARTPQPIYILISKDDFTQFMKSNDLYSVGNRIVLKRTEKTLKATKGITKRPPRMA